MNSTTTANPWNFDTEVNSPNGALKAVYKGINEIAMGSPLIGQLYIHDLKSNSQTLLSYCAGGPALWAQDNNLLAFPVWIRRWFARTDQKLAVVDIGARSVFLSKDYYSVIATNSFEGNLIHGVNSPIFRSRSFTLRFPNDFRFSSQIENFWNTVWKI